MKIIKWILASLLLSVMVLGTVSCTDDNGIQEPVGDSQLKPEEHKQKLDEIAAQFITSFNVNDYKDVIETLNNLSQYSELQSDEEITPYSINSVTTSLRDIIETKDPSRLLAVANETADFIYSIEEALGGEGLGIRRSYDKATGEWTEEFINERAFIITWDDSEIRFEYSEETTTYRIDRIENVIAQTIDVVIPNEIEAYLKINGKEKISLNFKPNLSKDGLSIEPKISLTIVNLTFKGEIAATPEKLGFEFSLDKEGKELLSAYANIAIDDFTDPNNWVTTTDIWDDSDDSQPEYYLDPSERFLATVKTGEFRLKILTAEIRGEGNLRNIIDGLYFSEPASKESLEEMIEFINSNAKIELIYTDENLRAAVLRLQVVQDGSDIYIQPVLVFGDGSRVSFDDFFEYAERDFQKTMQAIQDMIAGFIGASRQ